MQEFRAICERAVRAAGEVLVDQLGQARVRKKGPADLVTEADFASQEVVRRIVLGAFPNHAFLGEEDLPSADARASNAEFRWIVDPIDGTTNFVHRVPHFCVSLALEQRGTLLVGCVYNPISGECFCAEAGKGAQLNGEPIHTSRVETLEESLAAVGLPNVVGPESPDLKLFNRALSACQAIRRTGSAALNLCYLAAGRFDVAWNYSTKIWDVAAGALMIQEAGGSIASPEGGVFVLDEGRLLAAANPGLLRQLEQLAVEAGI